MGDQESHGNEFVADCRVRQATDLFLHTWTPVVLVALRTSARRRHDLRESIGGISDKVLTDTLRRLERSGLVSRSRYAEMPPRVDYKLTELGRSLVDGPIAALGAWTLEHGDTLTASHKRFDSGG